MDDRFEELLADLAGFYRSWLVYLGLETGLLAALRDASGGLSTPQLAAAAGCSAGAVDGWARASFAHGLLDVEFVIGSVPDEDLAPSANRFRLDPDLAAILLDETRPEFLGGQFAFTVGASLDYGSMADFLRTGRPSRDRTARFHRSVEKLNTQDTALFHEQALAALPDLAERLSAGTEVLDVGCGGGGWLLTLAAAYSRVRAVGIEFDPEWLQRARARVRAAGLEERITVEERDPSRTVWEGRFGLVYFQDVLHELPDPAAALQAAWRAVAPKGMLLVFDWCMPSSWGEYRTQQGELLWGYQLDELFQGTSLLTRKGFEQVFAQAGTGTPERLELDAGATIFVLRRGE